MDKKQAVEVVKGWFHYFENCCNGSEKISIEELGKFLSPNFEIISNGQILGRNLSDYVQRMDKIHNFYTRARVSNFLEEPLVSGEKLITHYTVELTARDGQNSLMVFIAIATIKDGKISHWTQVAHQKGTGHWESMNP